MKFDNVFGRAEVRKSSLAADDSRSDSGRTMTLTFDDQFTACVVYNPPHRQAVCIEPYTTMPDPFALEARGVQANLRLLAPGETFRTRIEIRVD